MAKKILALLFALVFLGPAGAFADDSAPGDMGSKLAAVEQRLAKLEKQQETILQKEDEILESLKQLKVWVRRN